MKRIENQSLVFSHSYAAVLGILTILAAALFFLRLDVPELKSAHEARVVVTAENMVQKKDWVVPIFNDRIRLEKPPLAYWATAAARWIAGSMEEKVFRMPPALLGVAGVFMATLVSIRMFGGQTGLMTALFLSLTLGYLIEARSAEVDIYLTFSVTLMLMIGSSIFLGSRRRDWLWLLMGAAAALGALAKGPVVFFFAGPMILGGWYLFPDRRPRLLWLAAALLLFLLLSSIWPLLLIQRLGVDSVWQVWSSDLVRNVEADVKSRRPFYFYLILFPLSTFPWSILSVAAVLLPFWKEVRPRSAFRQKTLWLTLIVLVAIACFSFVGKKKTDYLAPLLPMIAILNAAAWEQICQNLRQKDPAARLNQVLLAAQSLLLVVVGLLIGFYVLFDPFRRTAVLLSGAIGLIVSSAAALAAVFNQKPKRTLVAQSIGILICGYLLFGFFLPKEDIRISPARFCKQLRTIIDDAPIAFFQGKDETLVYHLQRPIQFLSGLAQLHQFLDDHPDGFVLVRDSALAQARQFAPHIVFFYPKKWGQDIWKPSIKSTQLDEDDFDQNPEPLESGLHTGLYVVKGGQWSSPPAQFPLHETTVPAWLTVEFLWVVFGLAAQVLFFLRFLVQWIASEKAGQSVIPVVFWWFSLAGGLMLLIYALYRKDPVFIFGQSAGVLIYARNLWLIYLQKQADSPPPQILEKCPFDGEPEKPAGQKKTVNQPSPDPVELSLVIPARNEEETIPPLIQRIREVFENGLTTFEVVIVDDGSTDGTLTVLKNEQKSAPWLHILKLDRPSGQTAAMWAGFQAARGRIVATLDADLQNDPAEIPRLMAMLDQADAVCGWRQKRQDSWIRRLSTRIANFVRNKVTGETIRDSACSLKVYKRCCLARLPFFEGMHRFMPTLVKMQGYRVKEVPVSHYPRYAGRAKYGVWNRVFRAFVDLLAVRWMQKRFIRCRFEEIHPQEQTPPPVRDRAMEEGVYGDSSKRQS